MAEKLNTDKLKTTSYNAKHIPKDAQVIMSIMKDMDITEYEPKVVNQLLEFTYRYVTCILDDAKIYSKHAKKRELDLDDIKLAIDMIMEKSFTGPPNRETLLEMARRKNSTPLPLLKPHAGVRLPPDRFCLIGCNYKVKPATTINATKKVVQQIKVIPTFSNQPNIKQVQQKSPGINVSTVLKRTGTIPSISKTQTVTIPKPVIKFSTTAQQKTIVKPKTQIITPTSAQTQSSTDNFNLLNEPIKMEIDDEQSLKRKREDDDYDMV